MLQPDPLVEPGVVDAPAAAVEHRLADVYPDDVCVRRIGERDGNPGGASRHVQDASRLETSEMTNQLAAPPAVLAQRQDLGQAVVARRQILEEIRRNGVLRARGRRAGLSHARLQGTGSRVGLDGLMRSSACAAAFCLRLYRMLRGMASWAEFETAQPDF